MTSKAKLRARLADCERSRVTARAVTFSEMRIDFDARQVEWMGRTINSDAPILVIPLVTPKMPTW